MEKQAVINEIRFQLSKSKSPTHVFNKGSKTQKKIRACPKFYD